jgi:SAM-dependent methyltransferase
MENLKAYFDQHESNVDDLVRWAKVHDEVCGWISQFGTTGKLLDVGCRRGELMRSKFFPKDIQYFGIDPLKVIGFEYDFDFRCETLESTTFGKETFDFLVIKDSVDCFAEPNTAFSSAFGILKKGGRLLISEDDHGPRSLNAFSSAFRILKKGVRLLISKAGRGPRSLNTREVEATYPNGDLSTLQILDCCIGAGFREVKKQVEGSRLFLSAMRP